MTDQLDLDGLEGLLAEATPLPWQNGIEDLEGIVAPLNPGLGNVICIPPKRNMYSSLECWPDNAALIVAAVNALPDLITRLRAAEAATAAAVEAFDDAISTSWQRSHRIKDLEQALTWALSEIDGETNYESEDQRAACLEKARAALPTPSSGGG